MASRPSPTAPGTALLTALAILIAVLASVGAYRYQADDEAPAAAPARADRRAVPGRSEAAAVPALAADAVSAGAPRGANRVFRVGHDGELAIDADTVPKLDALIAAVPSPLGANEREGLERAVREDLPAAAAERAAAILHRYLAYAAAERELLLRPRREDLAAASGLLEQVVELRRRHFGAPLAQAMFGLREAEARMGIEIAGVEADPSLGADEKARRIESIRQAHPAQIFGRGGASDAGPPVSEQVDPAAMRLPF